MLNILATFMIGALLLAAGPARAEPFRNVTNVSEFKRLVAGRELSLVRPILLRNTVRLNVAPGGQIRGKAVSWDVTGSWRWDGGFFCREMNWGGSAIPFNCQLVQVAGNRVRFISDRGAGDRAEFELR